MRIDELEVLLGTQVENHVTRETEKWKEKLQNDTNKYRHQKQYVNSRTLVDKDSCYLCLILLPRIELATLEEELTIRKVRNERELQAKYAYSGWQVPCLTLSL